MASYPFCYGICLLTVAFASVNLRQSLAMPFVRNVCLFLRVARFSSARRIHVCSGGSMAGCWPGATNLRSQPAEAYLGTANAGSLIPKWIFTRAVTFRRRRPVGTTAVFVPIGTVIFLRRSRHRSAALVSSNLGVRRLCRPSHASVLPSITTHYYRDSESTGAPHNGTNVIAVNQQTGSLLWMTQSTLILRRLLPLAFVVGKCSLPSILRWKRL